MTEKKYQIEALADYVQMSRLPGFEVGGADIPDLLDDLQTACDSLGSRKVLVTGVQPHVHLTTVEVLDLGEQIAKLGLKMAILQDFDTLKEDAEFLGAVAFNRGGSVEFFEDETTALNWLLSDLSR